MLESHFNKVITITLQVSVLQFHWKKGLEHRCFLVNFARYLRHIFYRIPPDDENYFINKIVKNPLEKREKIETACKKNNHTGKAKT